MKAKVLLSLFFALLLLNLIGCRPQNDARQAEEALRSYFTLLNEGKYAEAAALYGGSYDVLVGWNPDVDKADTVTLLRRGCTMNGLQCLPLDTVGAPQDLAGDAYRFDVTFANPDGGRFETVSPNTGERTSTFPFTVVKTNEGFRVQELPAYVP